MKVITFFTFMLLTSVSAQADDLLTRTALNGKVTFTPSQIFCPMSK